MELTDSEQDILDGSVGEGRKFAMNILTNIGDLYGAGRLVNVKAVQINRPYSDLGIAGWIELLKFFSAKRLKASVPTYTDSGKKSYLDFFKKTHLEKSFEKQETRMFLKYMERMTEIYKRLGLRTRRLYPGKLPGGDQNIIHMAVSDPGTAVFLNSRFGIRTNNESSVVALAASIIGKTTLSGLHLLENRIPDIVVRIRTELKSGDLGLVGLYIGELNKTKIPYFNYPSGAAAPSDSELFELSSALAQSGKVPMFHIARLTPEHNLYRSTAIMKRVRLNEHDLRKIHSRWRSDKVPDAVILGAPYLDLNGLRTIAGSIKKNGRLGFRGELWVFTSSEIIKKARSENLIGCLNQAKVKVFTDCWFEDAPVNFMDPMEIATDSVRILGSLKINRRNDIKIKFLSTAEAIDMVIKGELP